MAIMMAAIGCALSSPASAQVQDQFQILHSFGSAGDGSGPTGLLVLDQEGNLYGTALGGVDDGGIVYELTPEGNGEWTETILHNFPYNDPNDGYWPTGVVIDGAGNLYGATSHGGLNDRGTVFELMPGANGQWTESIVYNFCSLPDCADGGRPPYADAEPGWGLYGSDRDTAFELTPGSGGWTFNLLYTFCSQPNCTDGRFPSAA
jgi:uncharacterized repeat protein (TIGR03803 family)